MKGARISAVGNTSLWGRVKKKENYMLFKYNLNLKIENDVHELLSSNKIFNAVFYRYHGHHRLNNKFLVFTDTSNELFRISSIEIEVSIIMQQKIEVKSIGNKWGTKNKKTWKSLRIIALRPSYIPRNCTTGFSMFKLATFTCSMTSN